MQSQMMIEARIQSIAGSRRRLPILTVWTFAPESSMFLLETSHTMYTGHTFFKNEGMNRKSDIYYVYLEFYPTYNLTLVCRLLITNDFAPFLLVFCWILLLFSKDATNNGTYFQLFSQDYVKFEKIIIFTQINVYTWDVADQQRVNRLFLTNFSKWLQVVLAWYRLSIFFGILKKVVRTYWNI